MRSAIIASLLALGLMAQDAPTAAATPATSYRQVAKYLNPDGDFYLYLDSSRWAPRLENLLATIRTAVEDAAPEADKDDVRLAFYFVAAFVRDSGLRDLGGIGASSVATAEGRYHNRVFLQHPVGGPKGLLWDAFTAENRPFDLLQRLPADTAFACWSVVHPAPAWEWVKATVEACGDPNVVQGFHKALDEAKRDDDVDPDLWFRSLAGGVGLVVTLDPEHMLRFPMDGTVTVEVPAFTVALILEVKDDTLFDLFRQSAEEDGEKMTRVDKDGIRSYLAEAEPLGDTGLMARPTFARFGPYLVIASTPELIDTLAARQGGLVATPQFQRWQQAVPQEGFAFSYLSPLASRTAYHAIVTGAKAGDPQGGDIVAAALEFLRDTTSFSVALRTPDGVAEVANQSYGVGVSLLVRSGLQIPILSGAMLPALAQSREKARRINDAANLKQIGLGLRMYSADHGEKFPDDLGVLMEEDYLRTGKVYICPNSRTAAPSNAAELRAGQCDYLYFGKGRNEDNCGTEDPIACTKPGLFSGGYLNVLYGDGHVKGFVPPPADVQRLIDALPENP